MFVYRTCNQVEDTLLLPEQKLKQSFLYFFKKALSFGKIFEAR